MSSWCGVCVHSVHTRGTARVAEPVLAGARRYMPAEHLPGSYMTKAVDVYSFAMLTQVADEPVLVAGARRYMPAELLLGSYMTKAVDVYSFAMLMHELLTGAQLFEGMRQSQVRPSLIWFTHEHAQNNKQCRCPGCTVVGAQGEP